MNMQRTYYNPNIDSEFMGSTVPVTNGDTLSDSYSLTTTMTEGGIGGGEYWERKAPVDFPVHSSALFNQPFLNDCLSGAERDLYEFLKEAQLEHYYIVLTTHLKIRSIEQIKYVEDSDLTELGFSRPEQRRLRKYFKRRCPQTAIGKLRKHLTRLSNSRCTSPFVKDKLDGLSSPKKFIASPLLDSSIDRKSKLSLISFRQSKNSNGVQNASVTCLSASDLVLGTSLGQGEFGHVFQGIWHHNRNRRKVVQVAIKIMDRQRLGLTEQDIRTFLDEIGIAQHLVHPGIVQLYGVCINPTTVHIITELAPLRSLLECLREPALRSNFSVLVLHLFAIQLGRAMAFLEESGLVHRDLAARNVLVFSKDVVKISDFGMSRALQLDKSYYQSNFNMNLKLPTAWCAPECIHDMTFTSASDIWAYGVTLWEIFTYGFTPWAGLTGCQILDIIDAPHYGRLEQPEACSDPIYDAVMRACWAHEPKARPTFNQLMDMLPRLSPESWITTSDYHPDQESPTRFLSDGDGLVGNRRPSSRPMFVRANEMVYVLGKRTNNFWKVINSRTGLVGSVPRTVLKPCTSSMHPSEDLASVDNLKSRSTFSLKKSKFRISRRASLSDVAFGNKMSPFSKNHGPENSSIGIGSTMTLRRARLTPDQISLPQNDFRHVGHVGPCGETFGELGLINSDHVNSKDNILHLSDDLDEYNENYLEDSISSKIPQPILPKQCSYPLSNGLENHNVISPSSKLPTKAVDDVVVVTSDQINRMTNGVDKPLSVDTTKPFTLDDIKLDLDITTNGMDLGASLFDEVFKCFKMNGSLEQTSDEGRLSYNSTSTLTVITTANNTMNSTQSCNTTTVTCTTPLSTFPDVPVATESVLDDSKKEWTDPQPFVVPNVKLSDNDFVKSDGDRIKSDGDCIKTDGDCINPDADCIKSGEDCTKSHSDRIKSDVDMRNSLKVDESDRPRCRQPRDFFYTFRSRSRARSRFQIPSNDSIMSASTCALNTSHITNNDELATSAAAKPASKSFGLWKRGSLSNLTRRSSSVSKTMSRSTVADHSSGMLDSTDGLAKKRSGDFKQRLTISRPVLVVSRPNSTTRLSSALISSPMNGELSGSSSALTSQGGSSLTIVSSFNGCGPQETSDTDNNPEDVNTTLTVNSPQLNRTKSSTARNGVGSYLTAGRTANSVSQGLKALRTGDAVFRAPMANNVGGTLSQRRKRSGLPISDPKLPPTTGPGKGAASSMVRSSTPLSLKSQTKNLAKPFPFSSSVSPPSTLLPVDSPASNGDHGQPNLDRSNCSGGGSSIDFDGMMASFLNTTFSDFLNDTSNGSSAGTKLTALTKSSVMIDNLTSHSDQDCKNGTCLDGDDVMAI